MPGIGRGRWIRKKETETDRTERFWLIVDTNGPTVRDDLGPCWVWVNRPTRNGYGVFGFENKQEYAHRYSWELHFGPIPPGLEVCHKCDNRRCVRSDHLFLGTQKDNIRDAAAKGRLRTRAYKGEENGSHKLTEKTVLTIRNLCAEGVSQKELIVTLGMSQTTISAVVARRSWKHI